MTTPGKYFKLARDGDERVTPIELILDVVFVLAFSECTAYGPPGEFPGHR